MSLSSLLDTGVFLSIIMMKSLKDNVLITLKHTQIKIVGKKYLNKQRTTEFLMV